MLVSSKVITLSTSFVADPTFSSDSKVRIYNLTGTLLKTLTTGIGTNGFYKN